MRETTPTNTFSKWKFLAVGLSVVATCAIYFLSLEALGARPSSMFSLLIPVITAYMFGARAGVVAAFGAMLINAGLFYFTVDDWLSFATRPAALMGLMANMIVAATIGHIRDVSFNLQQEITRRKKTEVELHKAKITAEKANTAKGVFLANVSHEIRTPMNGVIGLAELLLLSELTQRQKDQIENIRNSTVSLLDIINDILDFSKIEAEKLELEVVPMDIRKIIHDVMDLLEAKAHEKNLTIKAEIDENIPRAVFGDPLCLRRILLNLAGNAIKFTEQGLVDIRCTALTSDSDDVRLLCRVSDTGIGIDEDHSGRLFQPFSQMDTSTTRRYGGTGLGLAISRQLVNLMDGEIGVESAPNVGSTFWFKIAFKECAETLLELPTPTIDQAKADSKMGLKKSPNGQPYNVLVVEDNEINREVFKQMLELLKLDSTLTENGKKAVAALCEKSYDIVLMDLQMPVMDGIEASKIIRSPDSSVLNHDVPIIAVTAHAMDNGLDEAHSYGMNDFVTKPFTVGQLEEAINRHLPKV